MPALRRRPAAKRAATPSASCCKARRLTSARRPDFAAFAVERLGLALRIGAPPEHARANQWQQITKRLPPQLNRTVRPAVWPVRRLLLPACAIYRRGNRRLRERSNAREKSHGCRLSGGNG